MCVRVRACACAREGGPASAGKAPAGAGGGSAPTRREWARPPQAGQDLECHPPVTSLGSAVQTLLLAVRRRTMVSAFQRRPAGCRAAVGARPRAGTRQALGPRVLVRDKLSYSVSKSYFGGGRIIASISRDCCESQLVKSIK